MHRFVLLLALCLLPAGLASAAESAPVVYNGEEPVQGPDAELEAASDSISIHLSENNLFVDNGRIRLFFRSTKAGFRPEVYAPDAEGTWQLVIRAARPGDAMPTAWAYGGCPPPLAYSSAEIVRNDAQGVSIKLNAADGRHKVTVVFALDAGSPYVHVTAKDTIAGSVLLDHFLSNYTFTPPLTASAADQEAGNPPAPADYSPDFAWAPRLRGVKQDVIGDEHFGAPAAMAQKGQYFAALVPDVTMLSKNRPLPTALNLDCSRGQAWMSYGRMQYEHRKPGYDQHTGSMFVTMSDTSLEYGFYLFASAQAKPHEGYRQISDFLWQMLDKPSQAEQVQIQQDVFASWSSIWPAVAEQLKNPENLSFTQEKQTMASVFGLSLYAIQEQDADLSAAARGIVERLLKAPAEKGVLPVAYHRTENADQWLTTDAEGQISTADIADTGRWLLKWRKYFDADNAAILEKCKAVGDLLLKAQLPSGCIPARLKAKDLTPVQGPLYDAGAECAEPAAFLAELHSVTKDDRYAVGAMSTLQFIRRSALATGCWTDRSVSTTARDAFTGQYPQSTAAMVYAAKACAETYRHSGERQYLELGRQILSYLSLFQNAWSSPILGSGFGSIPDENIGSSVSSELQARAANAYLDFLYLTGDATYLDRGTAALRAAFAALNKENLKDDAGNIEPPLAATLVYAQELRDLYGDAAIDVTEKWAGGINGCYVQDLEIGPQVVRFDLISPLEWHGPALVKFWQCPTPREVVVNGKTLGVVKPAELWTGLKISPRPPLSVSVSPVTHTLAGTPLSIPISITGGSAETEVTLFCRKQKQAKFTEIRCTKQNETYIGRFPATLLNTPGVVEYYIGARSKSETATKPAGAPENAFYTLYVEPALTIKCGTDDSRYLSTEAIGQATADGRLVKSNTNCIYQFPLPRDISKVRLELERRGTCSVFIGDEAQTAVSQDGEKSVYELDDPRLWQGDNLLLKLQAPDNRPTLLRSIKLIPEEKQEQPQQ